jgi:DNA gyrase/topoisomerase IV subunit A
MIESVSLVSELKQDFLTYSTSIFGRALPDVVDGLKSAQRRAIVGLKDLKLDNTSHYIKVSRLEGHVLGFYHPQGGCAGTIINMGQQSAQRYTLTDIHGNVGGSIQSGDNIGQMVSDDPPAAARYLEVRSTELCDRLYLSEIDKSLGDWKSNYDNTCSEPVRFVPALPAILLTGAHGIASGYACSHIPHHIKDVISASISIIKNPKITDGKLLEKFSRPPEPPQGGRIVRDDGISGILLKGQGSVTSYGRWEIQDEIKWGKRSVRPGVIITHLASGSSEGFLDRARSLAEADKLPGLLDVADYSSRDGIRIILVFKSVEARNQALPYLINNTGLRHKYSVSSVVVGEDGKPHTLGVREMIMAWYGARVKYLCDKYTREADKLRKEKEKLLSVIKVLSDTDKFIGIVRSGKSKELVIGRVSKEWGIDLKMSEYIVSIPISSLIRTEIGSVRQDCEKVQSGIDDLKGLCHPGADLDSHICDQIASLRYLGGPARAVWMAGGVPETPEDNKPVQVSKRDVMKREALEAGISTRTFNTWLKENLGSGNLDRKWEVFKHQTSLRTRSGSAKYKQDLDKLKDGCSLPSRGKFSWNSFLRSLGEDSLPLDSVKIKLSLWVKNYEKAGTGRSPKASSPGSPGRSQKKAGSEREAGPSGKKRGSGKGTGGAKTA